MAHMASAGRAVVFSGLTVRQASGAGGYASVLPAQYASWAPYRRSCGRLGRNSVPVRLATGGPRLDWPYPDESCPARPGALGHSYRAPSGCGRRRSHRPYARPRFPLTNLNTGEPQTSVWHVGLPVGLATSGSGHVGLIAYGSATVTGIRERPNIRTPCSELEARGRHSQISPIRYTAISRLMLALIALATFLLLTRAFRRWCRPQKRPYQYPFGCAATGRWCLSGSRVTAARACWASRPPVHYSGSSWFSLSCSAFPTGLRRCSSAADTGQQRGDLSAPAAARRSARTAGALIAL